MKSILIAWELGGGWGHLMPMLPLVERFCRRGHRVTLVVRDLTHVARSFEGLNVSYFQAPLKTTRPENVEAMPRNMAHILHNAGYANYDELRGLAQAWRNLYEAIRPDLILADHSPTALLAASGLGARTATTGTGFCCPPDVFPMPDFRPWMKPNDAQLCEDESVIVGHVNRILRGWGTESLERLGQLYGNVDECFLATFRELDHFPKRIGGHYWGAWPNRGGDEPVWPTTNGKRVFAYLKVFPAMPDLLKLLNELQQPTLVYCDRVPAQLRRNFESATLRFADRPLDLNLVSRECDAAILNAGHGATVSMLLAGKPILQIPLNLEQMLTASATARLSAGMIANPKRPVEIASRLTSLLTDAKLTRGAQSFASRYADYDPEKQLDRFADRIDELLHIPSHLGISHPPHTRNAPTPHEPPHEYSR